MAKQLDQKAARQHHTAEQLDAQEKDQAYKRSLAKLKRGRPLIKVPRKGKAKVRRIQLTPAPDQPSAASNANDRKTVVMELRWKSSRFRVKHGVFRLETFKIVPGQSAGTFANTRNAKSLAPFLDTSFSLVSPERTLDLIASDKADYDEWMRVLTRLVSAERA
mmetsp:Transcript_11983/g.22889  ORF Transcript_11983/g.22889 Transcript_11983/m.22889 type:complete len:163 (-) Transcript_11983:33-521(-)